MARKKNKPEPASTDMPALRLEWRSPDELTENPSNWRTHPDGQTTALRGVLAQVGWAGACLYNETTGRLIDGHARRKIAIADKTAKIPVLVGAWTEEQERLILATLDPIGAMAEANTAALEALLALVQTEDAGIKAMLEELAAANPVVAALPEAGAGGDEFDTEAALEGECRVKSGELWVIGGKHRLLCGDSTRAEDVARVMGGEKAGLCFTSPPYAQQRDYGEKAKEKVQDWYALMCGVFANLPMTDDGQVLVNLGLIHRDGEWQPYWQEWIEWMRSQGWRRFGWYVWDKLSGMPGDWNGRLAPAFEFIWHFNNVPVYPVKATECKDAGRVVAGRTCGADGEYRIHTGTKNGEAVQSHKVADNVIRCGTVKGQATEHPATMPIGLVSPFIESWPADVFDPFLGSGTTLIAAHRLNRRCFGLEIEPKYAEVILRRAEAEGLTVELAEGV